MSIFFFINKRFAATILAIAALTTFSFGQACTGNLIQVSFANPTYSNPVGTWIEYDVVIQNTGTTCMKIAGYGGGLQYDAGILPGSATLTVIQQPSVNFPGMSNVAPAWQSGTRSLRWTNTPLLNEASSVYLPAGVPKVWARFRFTSTGGNFSLPTSNFVFTDGTSGTANNVVTVYCGNTAQQNNMCVGSYNPNSTGLAQTVPGTMQVANGVNVPLAPTPPVVLTCPTNTTAASCQTQAAVNTAFANWLATASGTGGCNGVLTNNNTGAPNACGGSTTVTFTYTSTCAPLTSTCQATFTVAAETPLVIICPTAATAAACQTQAAIDLAYSNWINTANTNGGCNVTGSNNGNFSPSRCGEVKTVTFQAFSTCAPLTQTCQSTFTVTAPAPVVLNCPTNMTAAACQTQAAVNSAFATWLATASGSGGCGGVLTNNNTGAPSACGGSTTVTFTYTSTCAPLTSTCQATFTVTAAPPPSLTCPAPLTRPGCQTTAQDSIALQNWFNTASFSGGCNGVVNYNGFNGSPPNRCGGTKTLNITYSSSCAAPLNCSSTFTIPNAPTVVLNCPVNTNELPGQTQAAINTKFAAWLATASASGGCSGSLSNNNTGAPPAGGGSTTVTFTYTSTCAPLTSTCQATFSVSASPPVVLNCPVNTTASACQTQAAVNTAFASWLATANASGGCNGVLTNNNTGAPSACGGSTTVTFTYTSTCAPLTSTCQATFTVAAAPTVVLTCPTNITTASCQTQAAVNTAFANWLATVSASGGCGGVLTNNNTGAPSACGGSTTVTFTYTSTCAPLTSTCQATFTVPTPAAIVLTCPVNTTAAACQTQAAVNAAFATWLATASGTGGCGVLTNNNTGAPSACGGSTTVTFTYTSTCFAPTTTCQATFTVAASPTVVLTCPTSTTAAACQTQAAVNTAFATWLATASASGGCGGVLTNNNVGAPAACGGSTTVTFTYTSTCAPLTTTCQATFTVAASPTVVLTCPVNTTTSACQTQAAVNTAFATWLATASASGGCGGVLTNNNTGAPSACGGSTTVTFTYTSTCAPLTTTCQATFTVAAPPTVVLTCPTSTTTAACQTQAAVNTAFATWLATASASGGCGGVLTNNNTGAPSACGGSTTVTFTYTSTCAPLTTTCQATFTVTNATQPVLTCPAPTTASACLTQAQLNTAYATWLASATATGGCGGGTLSNNAPAAPLICNANANTITVVFTYSGGTCQTAPVTCTSTFTVPAYPTFTVPANGASQVACPAQIVQPTPPVVVDGCSKTLTPTGPVITNSPATITCEGTRTFVWTYTDCSGHVLTWSHVVTVERQPFSVPANGGSTVACPGQTDTQPTPPVVTSNCGEVLTPVVTSTAKPNCEGTRNWNFTYTDCEGNTATWSYIYTVEYLDFPIPASETMTVECPLNATQPVPPTVKDNCGITLTPIGPVITTTNNASGCLASRKYTWTYKDCEGNSHAWSKTFNFAYSADFFVYPDGEAFVGCLIYAQSPGTPPDIYDNCGQLIGFTGPVITESVSPDGCSGTRKFTFTYKDCGGHTHPWSFTYHAVDNEPPVGHCPNVNVVNLACIGDVPCPGTYDFSTKIAELVEEGDFYDVCSGDVNVTLDSWSALWQCSQTGGIDSPYTFGRTFYFSISDDCGNVFPELCAVTYSGVCLPLETFSESEWGNEGGEPGASTPANSTDLQTITTLLGQGPLVVGGGNRSLTLTDAQCIMNFLPGIGNPNILGNCNQTNCGVGCNPAGPIGMKNDLATNTIALVLNMRFNVQYHALTMNNIRNQSLACITIDPNIKFCAEGAGCKLRVFESNGTVHEFPYTIGGLLDLANLFLGGNLVMTDATLSVYANALNKSIANVNNYWHNGITTTACNPAPGANAIGDVDKALPTNQPNIDRNIAFSLAPNPASSEVSFTLSALEEAQDVTLEIYNPLGQLMLRKDFGKVAYVSDKIDLTNFHTGLYIVSMKAGAQRFEQKLVISKD